MSDVIIGILLVSGFGTLSGAAKIMWDKMERLTIQVDALQAENAEQRLALAAEKMISARQQVQIDKLLDENRILRRALQVRGIAVESETALRPNEGTA